MDPRLIERIKREIAADILTVVLTELSALEQRLITELRKTRSS